MHSTERLQGMSKKVPSQNEAKLHPLFVQAVKGDARAYEALLSAVSGIARAYVNRKTSGNSQAEDVVQEILISVHKALPTYDPERACMPWLAAIMHYRLSDWLRKQYKVGETGKVPFEEVEHFLESHVTDLPFEFEYVNDAVSGLSEKQQAVLQCMYKEELTVAETAEKLDMGVSAVKVTAHRAYKLLRKQLAEEI